MEKKKDQKVTVSPCACPCWATDQWRQPLPIAGHPKLPEEKGGCQGGEKSCRDRKGKMDDKKLMKAALPCRPSSIFASRHEAWQWFLRKGKLRTTVLDGLLLFLPWMYVGPKDVLAQKHDFWLPAMPLQKTPRLLVGTFLWESPFQTAGLSVTEQLFCVGKSWFHCYCYCTHVAWSLITCHLAKSPQEPDSPPLHTSCNHLHQCRVSAKHCKQRPLT